MKKTRKISLVLAVLFCFLTTLPVSAAQTGSLLMKGITAPAVLYRVADAGGIPEGAFTGASLGVLTEATADAALAKQLQKYTKDQGIFGQEKTPDGNGQVFYEALPEGYYLVCSQAQKGEFAPFLLRIPLTAGDQTIYDVQAEPKAETPSDPVDPDSPPSLQPVIPQTGYIQWPKYLLAALGALCVAAGLFEVFRGREKRYE